MEAIRERWVYTSPITKDDGERGVFTAEFILPGCVGNGCYKYQGGHCSYLTHRNKEVEPGYCFNKEDKKAARMARKIRGTEIWESLD